MLTAKIPTLDLTQVWLASDPESAKLRVTFPINKWVGSSDTSVVYFEIEPGDRLARHTDSAEEVLYVISGEAQVEVGDESGLLSAGDLGVVPAMVPHGLANIGDKTVKVLGFFSEPEVISSFEEPIQPIGLSVLNQGAPPPA